LSHLPILSHSPQANSKAAAPGNSSASVNPDTEQSAQPFGEVLARQMSEKTIGADKKTEAVAPDVLIAANSDTQSADANITDTATPLSSDLLATLLPQSAANIAAQMNIPAPTPVSAWQGQTGPRQLKAATDSTNAMAGNTAASGLPATKLAAVAGKDDSIAAALHSPADSATAKRFELNSQTATSFTLLTAQPAAAPATQLQSMVNLNPNAVQVAQIAIHTPVTQDRWGDEFSQKITWLASSSQNQSAELHLNPPQLGPIDVVLKVSGDQASAFFTSPHAAVREAIEQSIPKLREMLADNGIMLGNTTVSDQSSRGQQGRFDTPRQTAAETSSTLNTDSSPAITRITPLRRHDGIVDTFA